MKNICFIALLTAFSPPIYAKTYVKCGKKVDPRTLKATGYELELSSHGISGYRGPVGKTWRMKLENEHSDWLPPNKNIVARHYESADKTFIEITVIHQQSISGPVGYLYQLGDYDNANPVLEKYMVGGFTGPVRIGTYQCLTWR